MAVLSWSNKFAYYTPVIVPLLGKKSNTIMPFASQNTVAITLPAYGCVLNFFGLGDPGPPTDDSELYSLANNNEPKSHLQSPDAKENHLLTWNASTRRCILMLWLPFAHRQGIWGPNGLLACAYLTDHVRLLKRYHVKCLTPALFLPPKFACQSIPDPELSYIFLRRWHPVGVQTWLHHLKTFYRVWIPLPRV